MSAQVIRPDDEAVRQVVEHLVASRPGPFVYQVRVSRRRLAEETGLSRRAVDSALERMTAADWITPIHVLSGVGKSREYDIERICRNGVDELFSDEAQAAEVLDGEDCPALVVGRGELASLLEGLSPHLAKNPKWVDADQGRGVARLAWWGQSLIGLAVERKSGRACAVRAKAENPLLVEFDAWLSKPALEQILSLCVLSDARSMELRVSEGVLEVSESGVMVSGLSVMVPLLAEPLNPNRVDAASRIVDQCRLPFAAAGDNVFFAPDVAGFAKTAKAMGELLTVTATSGDGASGFVWGSKTRVLEEDEDDDWPCGRFLGVSSSVVPNRFSGAPGLAHESEFVHVLEWLRLPEVEGDKEGMLFDPETGEVLAEGER